MITLEKKFEVGDHVTFRSAIYYGQAFIGKVLETRMQGGTPAMIVLVSYNEPFTNEHKEYKELIYPHQVFLHNKGK